jgi:protease-4
VFAAPTTLTGSIGVFVLKPAIQPLGEKLGAHQVTIKRAPYADALNTWRPWTPEEQAVAQRWVDAFYDSFITEVASSRKLDKAKVDSVARGRIWSGLDAKGHGLVDTLGGLHDALESAKRRAGTGDDVVYAVYGEPAGLFSSLAGEEGVSVSDSPEVELLEAVLPEPIVPALPEPLRSLASELGASAALFETAGVKAALPFSIRVE